MPRTLATNTANDEDVERTAGKVARQAESVIPNGPHGLRDRNRTYIRGDLIAQRLSILGEGHLVEVSSNNRDAAWS